VNKDIYFIDVTYGYLQDFRPAPGLPNQVYRFNPETGAATVAVDGFYLPNGEIGLLDFEAYRNGNLANMKRSYFLTGG
jgi:hypothetical protein